MLVSNSLAVQALFQQMLGGITSVEAASLRDTVAQRFLLSGITISAAGTINFPGLPFAVTNSTQAALPTAGTAGRLARVTDSTRSLWMDSGTQWFQLTNAVNALEFGCVADGTTDDTTALQAAYAAAKAANVALYLPRNPAYPSGFYKFTSTLTFDGVVDVIGDGQGATILKKSANVVGISITGSGNNGAARYRGFTLTSIGSGAGDTSDGIQINTAGGPGVALQDLYVTLHGGHGVLWLWAANCSMTDCSTVTNGGDGVKFGPTGSQFVNGNHIRGLDTRQNTGHGLNVNGGALGTYGNDFTGIIAQNNGFLSSAYGIRSNSGLPNYFEGYCESNTAGDVLFDTSSVRQFIRLLSSSVNNPAVTDNGTNNSYDDQSTGHWARPSLTASIPGTNIAGLSFSLSGGTAGAGATGHAGGALILSGGNAAGSSGAGNGGVVTVIGGTVVNGGTVGAVNINASNGGLVGLGASTVNGTFTTTSTSALGGNTTVAGTVGLTGLADLTGLTLTATTTTRPSLQFANATTGNLGVFFFGNDGSFVLRKNASGNLDLFNFTAAGILSLGGYTGGATWNAGSKYLVINTDGIVRISAIGPAS